MSRAAAIAALRPVALFAAALLAAGPLVAAAAAADTVVSAETAVVARYRVHDARGGHDLTLVRSDDRVEYRIEGDPIRAWTRTAEGVALQELYPAAGRRVVYTPGELRTLDAAPDWGQLGELIDPALRASLAANDPGTSAAPRFGESAINYRGKDASAVAVDLQWLPGVDLPLRYRRETGTGEDALRLVALERLPVAQAFTAGDDLMTIDHADLGDMELDPFVRSLSQAAAHTHASP